jgi:hypothetical protein
MLLCHLRRERDRITDLLVLGRRHQSQVPFGERMLVEAGNGS